MKRLLRFAILAGALAGALACSSGDRPTGPRAVSPEAPLRVAVTIRPLEMIVRELVDPADAALVKVDALIPAEATPHGFDPPPAQVAALERADLAVSIGYGLDGWAEKVRGTRPLIVFASLEPEGDAASIPSHGMPPHAHPTHHPSADPHLWLDPTLVAPLAEAVTAALKTQLAPGAGGEALAARLDARLARFLQAVAETDEMTRAALAPFQGRSVVTFHDSLHRYADRYGLVIASVLKPIEGVEPAPADLKQAIDEVRDHGITTLFVEPEYPTTAAERVAEQSGVRLLSIDTLGLNARSWQQMMEVLARTLVEGLGEQP
ncbi:MAG: metal ABC transporter substrate-binding protein [Acidobacteria bacterium]|nr:metal ABC transporter substrate-binding protein [Acidobacteriota bacterium]